MVTNHTSGANRRSWPRHAACKSAVRSREATRRACAIRICSRGVADVVADVIADDATLLFLPRLCLRLSLVSAM